MNPASLLTQANGETKISLGGYLLPAEDFSMSNFMRFDLGMSWIHPGGITSSENLLAMLKFDRDMRVLDLGCGLGSTSRLVAKRYGCEVVGIDRDASAIKEAEARNQGFGGKVSFKAMDGTRMDFEDNTFDCVIMQSVLCYNNKSALLREVHRVLKPGGEVGANESTWLQPPTPETAMVTRATVCETFQFAAEIDSWVSVLRDAGFSDVKSRTYEFGAMSPYQMLREEGLFKTFKIMVKVMLTPELNMRLGAISTYFTTFSGYFGYGLYVGSKPVV